MTTLTLQPVTPKTLSKGTVVAFRSDVEQAGEDGLPRTVLLFHDWRDAEPSETHGRGTFNGKDIDRRPILGTWFTLSDDGTRYVPLASAQPRPSDIAFDLISGRNDDMVVVGDGIKSKIDLKA